MKNIIIDTFIKGGPIMWPILITSFVAVTVIIERTIWWIRLRTKTQTRLLEDVYTALEEGNVKKASNLSRNARDPRLQVIWQGLNHHHTSLQNALQVAAGFQLEKAGRFLSVLDTIITLAPLLGLLGTVTGIMHAFNFVGNEELQAIKVSGGIAEALIATAAGLAIAIGTLLPYNFFNSRLAKFTFNLETAATNVELLLKGALKKEDEEKRDEAAFATAA